MRGRFVAIGVIFGDTYSHMWRKAYKYFDHLEDKVRGFLSHVPIFYALVAGVGIVLFWRGVWYTGDVVIPSILMFLNQYFPGVQLLDYDGPITVLLSMGMLLLTGIFVSQFIGNEIIISGLRGDKKTVEKTEDEIREEAKKLRALQEEERKELASLHDIRQELAEIKRLLEAKEKE